MKAHNYSFLVRSSVLSAWTKRKKEKSSQSYSAVKRKNKTNETTMSKREGMKTQLLFSYQFFLGVDIEKNSHLKVIPTCEKKKMKKPKNYK